MTTKYKPEYPDQAFTACSQLYATHADLAALFGVSVMTIHNWIKKHEEFGEAVKTGKDIADENVERSLYHRAVGYEMEEEKVFCNSEGLVTKASIIKRFAPNVTAAIFWLKNRQRDRWADVNRVKHEGSFTVNVSVGSKTPLLDHENSGSSEAMPVTPVIEVIQNAVSEEGGQVDLLPRVETDPDE